MPGGPAGGAHRSKTARRKSGLGKYKPEYRQPTRSAAPASRGRSGAGQAAWSNLILESINRIVKPNGDVVHQVRPMEDPREDEATWSDLLLTGGEREKVTPPDVAQGLTRRGGGGSAAPPREDVTARQARERTLGEFHPLSVLPLPWEGSLGDVAAQRREGVAEGKRQVKERREDLLGDAGTTDTVNLKASDVKDLTRAMTTKEYNSLTVRQRAAVDYNTMIADAVTKDLKNQDEYADLVGTKKEERYDKTVKDLFGEDRGSDIFAPETVAVLKQLAYNPTLDKVVGDKLADLDEYLGLRATVTDADLPALVGIQGRGRANIQNPESFDRATYVNRFADMAEELTERLSASRPLLQNLSESAEFGRFDTQFDASRFGGGGEGPEGLLGFNKPEFITDPATGATEPNNIDAFFQQAFENLSLKQNEGATEEILGSISEVLDPDELDKFFQYADIRSRDNLTYGLKQGREDVKYKSAQEFRKMLGLDRLRGEE